jgi:hypothetical protein
LKRFSAILFLLVLVFNFFGYRTVIAYLEKNTDTVLEQKLDNREYNDHELISIKTTLNLPYYNSSADYERAFGSINIDGVVYEYVKKRVYQDTLELLCLPNSTKTKLQEAKHNLAKSAADGQASVPAKKGTPTLKISLPDYCQIFETATIVSSGINNEFVLRNAAFIFSDYRQVPDLPPKTDLSLS